MPSETALGRIQDAAALYDLPDEALLDEAQTAELLGVKPGTLNIWRSSGRYALPYRKIGRRVRYQMADIRAWLESRTRGA